MVQQTRTNKQTNKIFCETVPVNQSSVSFLIGISMTINRTEDIRSVRQAFIAPHPLFYCSLIVMKKLSSEAISNAMYKALYHMAHVTRVIKVDYILEYSFLALSLRHYPATKSKGGEDWICSLFGNSEENETSARSSLSCFMPRARHGLRRSLI